MTKQQKVILIAALETLAAAALAALLVFSLWILCAPHTMASAAEKTGNYSFAVTCANLKYSYTNSVDDLSRCAEDSILSGKDKFIVKYGEKLLNDTRFDKLCEKKSEKISYDYKSYICANVAVAQYRRGDLTKAIKTADSANTEDGYIKLVLCVHEKGSAEDKAKLYNSIKNDYEQLANILQSTGD